jgi:hypothetical protein
MAANGQPLEPPDVSSFNENRTKFPPEQLLPYARKHIAWTPDGTRILASGDSPEEVIQKLEALGIHWSQVVHDYVDDPDLSILS